MTYSLKLQLSRRDRFLASFRIAHYSKIRNDALQSSHTFGQMTHQLGCWPWGRTVIFADFRVTGPFVWPASLTAIHPSGGRQVALCNVTSDRDADVNEDRLRSKIQRLVAGG